MKRNIFNISLVTLISVGCLTAVAKKEVIEGDWNDDWGGNPGNVDVNFKAVPEASFTNLCLVISVNDPNAKIMWTTEEGILPDDADAWKEYTGPIALTEDCVVSFYAVVGDDLKSEIKTYTFVYADHQTAVPVITVNTESSLLSINCSTPGSQIRYTTDGSEPTVDSELYTGELPMTSYVYRARAFAEGLFDSPVADYTLVNETLSTAIPTAVFENKLLTINSGDPQATILYTTDGEAAIDDADAWQVYTAPLALTENCIVRFFGRRENFNDSDVQSFSFVYSNYRAADPTIERNGEGTHIVMETSTEGGVIRYTTDGSEPTEESPVYTEPILIECNGTFLAKTFAEGLFDSQTNRYVVSNMAVSVPFADFSKKKFYLNCIDTKAEIWYTTNPDATVEDTEAWTLYTEPFSLTENCTLRFFSRRENFNDSDLESLAVVIAEYQLVAPTISRNAQGTHIVIEAPAQGPTMGSTPEDGGEGVLMLSTIHYTTDGSEPTQDSPVYEAPIRIQEGFIYKARSFDENWLDSEVSEYIIGSDKLNVPTGVFENFALKLTTPDEGAQIWYTTDPELTVDNVDAWTLYEAPLPLDEECTYRFFAGDDDANASDVQTFVFQRADYKVTAPTVERNDEGTHIVMATTTEGAEIRYTTDGSEPTEESYLYTEPVPVTCNATFRAKAFADGLYDSKVTDFVVSNMAVPVAYASFENKLLTLTCSDPEAAIWYTNDDDATPEEDEAWTLYEGPVALTENCFVHFFTRRDNFNDSDIETFVFLRANYMTASPAIERSEDGTAIVMSCDTEGAVIRYTTDGSEPTAESTVYTEPVFLTENCTFRAIAMTEGLFDSALSEYTVANMSLMDPYATFENSLLTLAIWDEEAAIWYTFNEEATTDDVEAWTLYTEPIAITENCTVRYFGRRDGLLDSNVMSYEVSGMSGVAEAAADALKVCREGNEIVIYAPAAARIAVYALNGSLVREVNVQPGRNVVDDLNNGVYIIGNVKIRK